jgi:branched-chain amino acid transport system substrate-binding protein
MRTSTRRRWASIRVAGAVLSVSLLAAACGASSEVERAVAARNARLVSGGTATAPAGGPAIGGDVSGSAPELGAAVGQTVSAPGGAGGRTGPASGGSAASAARPAPSGVAGSGPSLAASASPGATPATGPAAPGRATAGAPAPSGAVPGDNGGATDIGVTGDSIKIGGLYFNGSWLDRYTQIAEQAARAYFRYINDQGGIYGRKINYITCDTAGTADGTQSCARKMGDDEKVFALGPSMDLFSDTLARYISQKQLPWVGTMGYYRSDLESPYIFPTQLSSQELAGLMATFVGEKLRPKTVGVLWLKDFVGDDCLAQVRRTGQKLGFSVAVEASSGTTEDDMTPQVVRMRTNDPSPDAVLFCTDAVNQTKFMQAAARQNWTPPKGWVGAYAAIDDVPKAIGPTAKGMYAITTFDYYNGDTPGVALYRKITQHYYPSIFHHFFTQATYTGAVATVEALRKAGPQPTRAKYLDALRSMSDFDSGMGLRFDFANKLSFRHNSGLILQADENYRWQVVSDRFRPTL